MQGLATIKQGRKLVEKRENLLRLSGTVILRGLTGLLLLVLTAAAHAGNTDHALGVILGQGVLYSRLSERSYIGLSYRQAWNPDWATRFPADTPFSLAYTLSRFRGCGRGVCDQLTDVGFGPMVRHFPKYKQGPSWYVELGISLHLISQTHISHETYSSAVQFRELLGMGIVFGPAQHYDLGLSYVHESNADIKTPNDGMNFLLLNFSIRW